MRVYFDASVLISLFVDDALAPRASAYVKMASPTPVVSDFASAEFASAISRIVRMGYLDAAQAGVVFSEFDAWRATSAVACHAQTDDMIACEGFLRRLDLPLRTPDALNIAIARRLGVTLATFDHDMARSAAALGVELALADAPPRAPV
jgi:predicted nucleic acid-binding protein